MFHMAAAISACLVAVGLYRWMGFFGVGLLGLIILYVATSVDLNEGRHGGLRAGLYRRQPEDERLTRGERAALKGERQERRRSIDYAMMVGSAFLLVGGAGFLLFQLHLGR
jgi:hypothetical protein